MSRRHNKRNWRNPRGPAVFTRTLLAFHIGFCLHWATGCDGRSRQHPESGEKEFTSSRFTGDGANSQSATAQERPKRRSPKRVSQASGTESGRYGSVELIDAGDDTLDLSEFIDRQANLARQNNQRCLLVTMLPQCPSCAAFGYALAKTAFGPELGKIRVVRLDLGEFEDELKHLHLPIDRIPGFILLGHSGNIVDFLDAGEWNTNDPAEFIPIIEEFASWGD